MKIIEFLKSDQIHLNSPIHTRDEAIRLMIDEVYNKQSLKTPKPDIKKLIRNKNIDGGPAFGNGLCTYIWRTEEIQDLTVSMCLPKEPMIIDNTPISLITLVITGAIPKKDYVDIIYDLIMISENNPSMNQLCQVKTREDFIAILRKYHEEYEKF